MTKRSKGSHQFTQIQQFNELLQKQKILLVGGDCREEKRVLIQRDLGCPVQWISTLPNGRGLRIEPTIRSDGVTIVLLLIRFSRHCLGAVKDICRKYNKVFVRLPKGYNAEEIRHQIQAQVSKQLERRVK